MMRPIRNAAAFLLCLPLAAAAQPAPELIPSYSRTVLPNGLVLLILEQHEVPVVDFVLMLRSGSIADPAGREGLADVTLSMLRKGTDRYTSEQIAEELDFLGGTLELEAGFERCSASAQFLSKDVDRGLDLLSEVVLRPKFDAAELKKLIDLNVDGLRDLKDTPRVVVGNYYDSFLFGGHPFGRPVSGTETSLPVITRADVQSFYQHSLRPGAAILAVSGDFSADAMRAKVEKAFGGWTKGDVQAVAAPAPKPFKGRKVLLVDKPDAVQTYFRIGNVGIAKATPMIRHRRVVKHRLRRPLHLLAHDRLRTNRGFPTMPTRRSSSGRVPARSTSRPSPAPRHRQGHGPGLRDPQSTAFQGSLGPRAGVAKNYIRGSSRGLRDPGTAGAQNVRARVLRPRPGVINQHTTKTDAIGPADAKRVIAKHYPSKDVAVVDGGRRRRSGKRRQVGPVTERASRTGVSSSSGSSRWVSVSPVPLEPQAGQ